MCNIHPNSKHMDEHKECFKSPCWQDLRSELCLCPMSYGYHRISLNIAFQTCHLPCKGSSHIYWSNCWRKKHLAALPEGTSCPQWFQKSSRINCTAANTASNKDKNSDFPNYPKVIVDVWIIYNQSFVIFVSCIGISSAARLPRTPSHPDPRSPGHGNWSVANDDHSAFSANWGGFTVWMIGIYWISFGPGVLALRSGGFDQVFGIAHLLTKPKQAAN